MSPLGTVPSLDPRGRYRPRPALVRIGEVTLGWGLFGYILKILDAVSRGETAVDIYRFLPRFLGFVASPIFSTALIATGFLLLWRFAKASETSSLSRIIHPITKQPFVRPIYPAFRRAGITLGIALCTALIVWGAYQTRLRVLVIPPTPLPFVLSPPPVPKDALTRRRLQGKAGTVPLPSVPIKPVDSAPSLPLAKGDVSASAVPSTTPNKTAAAPVVIPMPSQPIPKPPIENKATIQPTATIAGHAVSASDKAGSLYVSLRLSESTGYRGLLDDKSVAAVKAALDKTGKISVFLGGYDIGLPSGGRRYGIGGLGLGKSKTIYYFDKTLGDACAAVQRIVLAVIGTPVGCVFYAIPPAPSDPNDMNFQRDFWLASGLDMEIVL